MTGRQTRCEGVTRSGQLCTRTARFLYVKRIDVNAGYPERWLAVKGYCAQHHDGAGPTKLLRPFPWEYETVIEVDQAGNVVGPYQAVDR